MTEPTSHRQRPDAGRRSTAAAARDASAQFANLLQLARIEARGNLRAVATLAGLFGGALLRVLLLVAPMERSASNNLGRDRFSRDSLS